MNSSTLLSIVEYNWKIRPKQILKAQEVAQMPLVSYPIICHLYLSMSL